MAPRSDPHAGSDAAAIATSAEPDGTDWRVSGEKAWISNAALADGLAVYAQTANGSGAREIGCFIIDGAHAGVSRRLGYELLGGHALGTGGFQFNHSAVSADAVLQAPGQAFRAALGGIDLARVTVSAMGCGVLGRALDEALAYTAQRPAFGHTLADFQGVQFILADGATDLEAARALSARAADAFMHGRHARRSPRQEIRHPRCLHPYRRLPAGHGRRRPRPRPATRTPSGMRENRAVFGRRQRNTERGNCAAVVAARVKEALPSFVVYLSRSLFY